MREHEIEKKLIGILTTEQNQWTYRKDLKTEVDLWNNLRRHIDRINKRVLADVPLTDNEFELLKSRFRALTQNPFNASQWLRGENGVAAITIEREEVTKGRITLDIFSNKDICGGISSYEVVHQILPDEDRVMRGDVTLLINGLPVIHIELKTEYAKDGYMQAFDQIKRYAESGYFNGIYATVQIFVISNKVATKYFARPPSNEASAFDFVRKKKHLFNWRTPENENIDGLFDFTKKVLTIPMAHELVSRFTVLVDDKKKQKFLMVLRPYQIHAIKAISKQASVRPLDGKGGFIWHATGSGKTITSFVATKLLAQTSVGVDRTVMILDRQDLDEQTRKEFGKFASEYQTGMSSGDAVSNTLIVEINNSRELLNELVKKKNNDKILIASIQKMSAANRKIQDSEVKAKKYERLKDQHIVFIVDECHRAVSDEQMKEIQKLLPKSTWFGLTGTPILEENQKQEKGTFARTTYQQYGDKLHAYTTKNAMDDKSVLGFQVEYFSTLASDTEEEIYHAKMLEKYPNKDSSEMLKSLSDVEKEELISSDLYEDDAHIEAMLLKIFKRPNIITKFKVREGYPTMSGILTTHSIAQAKRIYNKLQKMKQAGTLINGKFSSPQHQLIDEDFPRVAITYSMSTDQAEMLANEEEMKEIIAEYNRLFKSNESINDISKFNRNVNNRLARKDAQYQKDGNWLDLVIVVDRLLTGFDAPTIQTLYVDRELKYQKLLQAFSRTNRTYGGKDFGMVVTFRKPHTMKENVANSIRLFSDDDQNWEDLNPRDYAEILAEFEDAYTTYEEAESNHLDQPNDLKMKVAQVKAFGFLEKSYKALISYDEYNNADDGEEADYERLAPMTNTMSAKNGVCENLKVEIREIIEARNLENADEIIELLLEIEFSAERDASAKDDIDSLYIKTLLDDALANKAGAEEKLKEKLEAAGKSEEVKTVYADILASSSYSHMMVKEAPASVDYITSEYINNEIDRIIELTAKKFKISTSILKDSFHVYDEKKDDIPYIDIIADEMEKAWKKDAFEDAFNERYRRRKPFVEAHWKKVIQTRLLPLRGEL